MMFVSVASQNENRALGYRLPTARFANDVDVLSMLMLGAFDRDDDRVSASISG
jgi:hypothetical protein